MSATPPPLPSQAARWLVLCLAAFGALCLWDPGAPAPAALDAPSGEFSAARARLLLDEIARAPHPTGSGEQERVRGFLEARLVDLGVTFERQPWSAAAGAVAGVNLLVRLPAAGGARDSARVLCVAHYDSHPLAPGAGDDGAAVAAVLECLRVLRAEGSRANRLDFLLTDGEEMGLLGARAFAADAARLEHVAVVLDFEARGNAGPTILFETGRDDAAWIAAYAACATRPLAASLGPSIYERMPNDTDFTVFKRLGLPGLNFAFIGGGTAYHSPADRPENLDPRALQHHGETLLALARHLGDADLRALGAARGRATFFTLPGNLFVHYRAHWDGVVLALAALLAAGALTAALRTRRSAWSGLALGLLAAPCALALLAGAVAAAGLGLRAGVLALAPRGTPTGNGASSTWILLGLTALSAGAGGAFARRLGARARTALSAGALLLWLALALWSQVALPGASYACAWPALCGALALHAAGHLETRSDRRPAAHLVLWGAVLAGLALGLPTIKLLHQVGAVSPPVGVVLASALLGLGAVLGLPALALAGASLPRSWKAFWALASAALVVWGAWLEAAGR